MTAILAFLLLDWVFFTLIILGIITITWIHETEDHLGWAHTLFVLLACLVAYKMDYTYQSIVDNPSTFLQYIGIYLGIGIVWAFFKWFFYLKNISSAYNKIKEKAVLEYNKNTPTMQFDDPRFPTLKDTIYKIWKHEHYAAKGLEIKQIKDWVTNPSGKGGKEQITGYEIKIPMASDNKALIVSWISHWPISAIWTIITDPIKKLINFFFEQVKFIFQSMSNRIFKNVSEDFK